MERNTSHTGTPPDLTLLQLVHDIWTTKEELATLLRPSTPEARDRDTHLRALLTTRRHQLQEWHAHRIAAAAQERERYGRKDTPYKSLRYVSRILEDMGRRTIHAVRTPEEGLTNDPDVVLQAVLDSFQAQHRDALPDLDPSTRSTIREHVPRVFNGEQRRRIARQRRGVAIGGPCSAQCAQLYCLYHEVQFRQNKGKGCRLMKRLPKGCMPIDPYRYMDNIVGVICGSVSLSRIQKALHAVYGLELQQEGEGSVLPSLEAILSLNAVSGSVGLRLKPKVDYTLPPHKQLSRFPDKDALQSQRSAKSIAVQLGMKSSD